MKKKIVGIFVCMLLICMAFSVGAQVHIEKNLKEFGRGSFDDDVPTWEVGYSWTYTGEIQIENGINFYLNMQEAYFYVKDKSGGMYTLAFGGDITGSLDVPGTAFSYEIESVTGNIYLTQSSLGFKEADLSLTGKVNLGSLPFSAGVSFNLIANFALDVISFPLFVGKTWNIPEAEISIDITVVVLGITLYSDHFDEIIPQTFCECLSLEEVTAGGNTYNAYEISYGESMGMYYAPNVGNLVLLEFDSGDKELELIATSYPSPDNPQKPETPSGETNGKTGTSYEYTTKAIDPNGDQIMYVWDFDGDGIGDECSDLYNSGETITTEHTWDKDGTYNIQVKARDTTGLESVWSDPLPVTMPRNKAFNTFPLFLRFLENHPHMFPILRHLLGL